MRCSPVRAALALGLLSCAGGTAVAQDLTRIYSNGFENRAPGAEWSIRDRVGNNPWLSKYLGRFGNEKLLLTLDAVDPPDAGGPDGGEPDGGGGGGGGGNPDGGGGGGGGSGPFVVGAPARPGRPNIFSSPRDETAGVRYKLTFDLYLIDSWDGGNLEFGTDSFKVSVNDQLVFDEAFDNHHPWENFREPDISQTDLGYGSWNDSVYRAIEIWFEIDPGATTLRIEFFGDVNQALDDESWGIDRVRVDYQYVTIPSPTGLALFALGAGVGAARRRSRPSEP